MQGWVACRGQPRFFLLGARLMWNKILVALCLMMVVEGIWPFLDPAGMRRALLIIADQDNRTLRLIGLVSMVAGVAMLYLVN